MSTPQRGRKVQSAKKQTPSLRIFYIVIGLIAIGGAAWLITLATAPGSSVAELDSVPSQPFDGQSGTTAEGFYYKGDPESGITVIEYADYQCPACANFSMSSIYQRLNNEYVEPGQIQYIFHDFPLPQHNNAPAASHAAYCAGEQGQYWTMHDQIYATQAQWSNLGQQAANTFFTNLAGQIGLDEAAFGACQSSDKYAEHLQQARSTAMEIGIPATPTFVVNGSQVNGGELLPAIEAALAEKGSQ
jgi:protein-disulfide isomerase